MHRARNNTGSMQLTIQPATREPVFSDFGHHLFDLPPPVRFQVVMQARVAEAAPNGYLMTFEAIRPQNTEGRVGASHETASQFSLQKK